LEHAVAYPVLPVSHGRNLLDCYQPGATPPRRTADVKGGQYRDYAGPPAVRMTIA
jgi:hypothetical protein